MHPNLPTPMKKWIFSRSSLLGLLLLCLSACESAAPVPKPRAYPRVVYPSKTYQAFDQNYCQFTFKYPTYAVVEQNTDYYQERPKEPCWFDLFIPRFNCRIYCTYYAIGVGKSLDQLKSDAFELVNWHNKKANYIGEEVINRGPQLQGLAFSIDGPAATPFQFYLTDNRKHFFRASLYFNSKVNVDSLAPIYDFVKADMYKMIETMEWRN